MLRERLKRIDLKITELADYLQISRPTMYKYIDSYDRAEFDMINTKVLKLFNYINEHELVGKKNVINYILTKLVVVKELDDEETDIIKKIKKYIISNPESKKSQFLVTCATKDCFDEVIFYLVSIQPLLNKRKLTEEEDKKLLPYKKFLKEIQGGEK